MSIDQRQVIVVGAGISGLSAAKLLNENGVDVVVLEARDRVGGRTLTKRDPAVKYVDLGGAYVGPTQNRLLRLAKEFGIDTYKVNEEENIVHFSNGKRKLFKTSFPPYCNPFVLLDLNNFCRLIDKYGGEIPINCPWEAPRAIEWDQKSMKDWIDEIMWTKNAKEFAYNFSRVNVTSEAHEMSMLWFLWYIKLCGGIMRIFSTTNGGQERKFVGGSQQISEAMHKKLGDRVKLKKPVYKIEQTNNEVIVTTLDGNKVKAPNAILAIPPILQMKIHFEPQLSAARNQLIQRAPMGSVIKTNVYYKKNYWREKGMCGSAMIEGGLDYPIGYSLDDTKPDGTFPSLMGFILANKARRLLRYTKEERKIMIAKCYSEVFGIEELKYPTHYEEMNWLGEQYSGGCYTNMFPPGFLTEYGKVLREPIGHIYFAGTETAIMWSGYMEGAIQAGERAAREILFSIGKIRKDEIWQDEPPCKEVPALPFQTTFWERNLPSVPGFLRLIFVSITVGVAASGGCYYYYRNFK